MLKEFQNSNGIASGQRDPLVARHNLLRGRQYSAHDKSCEIQSFVGSCGSEKTLLFVRRAQFDPVVAYS